MSDEQRVVERDVGAGSGSLRSPPPAPTARGRRRGLRPRQRLRRYTPEERRAAVEAYVKSGLTLEGFARIWGFSRHTVYVWTKIYRERGPQGLDHPCGTGRRGRKPLAPALREEICEVQRRSKPTLAREGVKLVLRKAVAATRVGAIA